MKLLRHKIVQQHLSVSGEYLSKIFCQVDSDLDQQKCGFEFFIFFAAFILRILYYMRQFPLLCKCNIFISTFGEGFTYIP